MGRLPMSSTTWMKKKSRKKPDMMGSMQYVRICLMILREISSRSVKADGRSKHASGSWRQISQQDPFIFIGMRESMPTFSFVSYRCWSTGCWRRNWTRSILAQIFSIPFKTLSLQMFKDRDLSPFMSLRNWPMTYIEWVGLKRTMNSSQKERWKRFKNAANKDKSKNFLMLLYQNQKKTIYQNETAPLENPGRMGISTVLCFVWLSKTGL